jgi:hypothetical protein
MGKNLTELEKIHNLTETIRMLREVKTEISGLNAALKKLKSAQAILEKETLSGMDAMGNDTTSISTKYGTASVKESPLPHVKDWSLVHAFIQENGAYHLYRQQLSTPAFREFLELDEEIPGTEVFIKRGISLTKAKTP